MQHLNEGLQKAEVAFKETIVPELLLNLEESPFEWSWYDCITCSGKFKRYNVVITGVIEKVNVLFILFSYIFEDIVLICLTSALVFPE